MDLVERYIEAVKFWLPASMKEDVAAELKEDICSEIEEAEREKGRPLSKDEVGELLKARGAPLAVASKYLPQRSLIGPELYPLLRRLESQGLLISEWREEDKRQKRFYRLSKAGGDVFARLMAEWQGIGEAVSQIHKESGHGSR